MQLFVSFREAVMNNSPNTPQYGTIQNAGDEGGDFILCGEKVDLKQGDCVIFPSVFLYPHEVTPVTKGSRYSWVLWSW